jgi:hypothetical protein
MEKPRVVITSIDFSDCPDFPSHTHTIQMVTITYNQVGVDYPLKAYGEAATHQAALQDGLTAMDWNIALDSHYTNAEVRLLKTAHKLYNEHDSTPWYQENVLAHMGEVEMQMHVKSNPLRILAREKLLLCDDGDSRTLFRLSDLGKYVVESHPQFQVPD